MAVALLQAGGPLVNSKFFRFAAYCYFGGPSQLGIFTSTWYCTAPGTPAASLGDLATALGTVIDAALGNCMHSAASILGYKVNGINFSPPPLPGVATSTTTGGAAGDPTSASLSGIIKEQTNFSGRAYRGRMFVPFPSTAHVSAAGYPTAAYTTALTTLATALVGFTGATGAGGGSFTVTPVVFHRKTTTGSSWVGLAPSVLFGTQHRRGNYGKLNGGQIPL